MCCKTLEKVRVVELVDTLGSGPNALTGVQVQVLSRTPNFKDGADQ